MTKFTQALLSRVARTWGQRWVSEEPRVRLDAGTQKHKGGRGKIDSSDGYWILTGLHWNKCLLMAGHPAIPALGSRDCRPLKFM